MKNSVSVSITLENENEKRHSLTIPYQDAKGDYLIKVYEKKLKKEITQPHITHTGRKP